MTRLDVSSLLGAFRSLPPNDRRRVLAALLREANDTGTLGSLSEREMAERDRIEKALVDSQRELAESNHLLQLVLDTIPARVFWKDTELCYLGGNRRFADDAGVNLPERLVGKTDYDFFPVDQAELYRSDDQRVLETLQPKLDYDEPQGGAVGELRWLRTSKFPLRNADGKIIGVLGTYQDVTAQKQLQNQLQQAQKLEAVSQLAGGVAHDFNNLLTGILGNAELLAEATVGDDELVACAKDILKASRRAADLTQQLLAFSRKGQLQTADVDLHHLIRQTAKLLSHGNGPPLEVQSDLRAARSIVRGDPTQLGSALLNLALNAQEAMPSGGELHFTTRNCFVDPTDLRSPNLPPGRYVELVVRDTGVGIPHELQDRIFEPFFTTKKTGGGPGLGLAAVFGSMQSHGGHISVESTPGRGTAFTLLFPTPEAPLRHPTPTGLQISREPKGHILVVDDEEVVRNLTARALRKFGYEVTTCADGVEAVAYFQTNARAVHLVLLDLVMPRLDGAATFRQLKTIDPEVRVLLASGFTREKAADALIEQGARGFLAKPFRLDQLAREVALHQRPYSS